jgi:hypothetical protein
MSNSFEYNNYSIVSLLNEEDENIYIKIVDKITMMYYENVVDLEKLGVSFSLTDAYQIMNKCFTKEPGYNVTLTISPDMITTNMTASFKATIGGFLNISFDVILMEKIMSNDCQLTINVHKMEQQYLQTIETLTQRLTKLEVLVDAISNVEICVLKMGSAWPVASESGNRLESRQPTLKIFYNINTTIIEETCYNFDYSKIKLFYNLESLTTNEITSFHNNSPESVSLTTLTLAQKMSSFDFLIKLPNLTTLQINNGVYNNSSPEVGLPNLVSVLKGYKHKIKTITIKKVATTSTQELSHYALENNITLNISN